MSVQSLTTSQNNAVHAAVVLALALVVALLAFSDALFELVKRWVGQEEYSHGFLIPVVSAVVALDAPRRLARQHWSIRRGPGQLSFCLRLPCILLASTARSLFFRILLSYLF